MMEELTFWENCPFKWQNAVGIGKDPFLFKCVMAGCHFFFLTTHICPFRVMCAIVLSRLPRKTSLRNISQNKCVLCDMLLLFDSYHASFTVDFKCPTCFKGVLSGFDFLIRKLSLLRWVLKCTFSLCVHASCEAFVVSRETSGMRM